MKKSIKITSLLAWLWFGITLIMALVDLPNAFGRDNLQGSMVKALGEVINLLILLSFSLVGALIVSRQAGNNIGSLLMMPSLAFLLEPFIRSQITGLAVPPSHPSILFLIAAYLSNMYWLLGIFPVFLIALLFPTGKPHSPRLALGCGLCHWHVSSSARLTVWVPGAGRVSVIGVSPGSVVDGPSVRDRARTAVP